VKLAFASLAFAPLALLSYSTLCCSGVKAFIFPRISATVSLEDLSSVAFLLISLSAFYSSVSSVSCCSGFSSTIY